MKRQIPFWGSLAALLLIGFLFFALERQEINSSAKQKTAETGPGLFADPDLAGNSPNQTYLWFPHQAAENIRIADEEESVVESYFIPELNITHLVLKNGLKVCLKPTNFESDEVIIKLAAKGGYGSLPIEDRPSGELASQIAWESGMGGLTSDQMSVYLYEHSLDLAIKIKAFSREIEGVASSEGVRPFLDSIRVVFKKPTFTEEAKQISLAIAKKAISRADTDYEQMYESVFTQVNAPTESALRPLSLEELQFVDLKKSEQFFHTCFDNPADFTCVIVGSFDLGETKKTVARILGRISSSDHPQPFKNPSKASFPLGITNKIVSLKGHNDCLTRISFPLQVAVKEQSIHLIEFICQIVEARVRSVLVSKMAYSYGVDVSYEFPVYPYLNNPWISIRYRSAEPHVNMLKHLILTELSLLQTKGATEKEIEAIKRYQSNSEEYWLQENSYWVSALSNYYLWGWNPAQIVQGEIEVRQMPLSAINQALKNLFILSNYSIVTAKP